MVSLCRAVGSALREDARRLRNAMRFPLMQVKPHIVMQPVSTSCRVTTAISALLTELGLPSSYQLDHTRGVDHFVPHSELRLRLRSDPAMNAILPAMRTFVSLGDHEGGVFRITSSGVILLAYPLLTDPAALSLILRWAMEAQEALSRPAYAERIVAASMMYAKRLLNLVRPSSRDVVLSLVPDTVACDLKTMTAAPATATRRWLSDLIGVRVGCDSTVDDSLSEFELPLEALLVQGGDSRLVIDAQSGLNRYGVCPRPRPEAVHFSSSTASAISEHGFLACELARRWCRDKVVAGATDADIRRWLFDVVGQAVKQLLGLEVDEADVVILPSGTDAELVTMLISAEPAATRPLVSILPAPDESGRGVRLAASGRYFDSQSSNGLPITKGATALIGPAPIVHEVHVRNPDFEPRPREDIDAEVMSRAREALATEHRVLVHVLHGSKTGLVAPSNAAIKELRLTHGDRVDVAIDACQLRSSFEELGQLVRDGCMVQTSGSKFLTGPPFSGAIILPISIRARVNWIRQRLQQAPAVCDPECWTGWWHDRLGQSQGTASTAPALRWLPALLEARLFKQLRPERMAVAMERFRSEIVPRIGSSRYLRPLDEAVSSSSVNPGPHGSIVAFEVLAADNDGSLKPLGVDAAERFFRLLNQDLTSNGKERFGPLDRAIASVCCHIGQPVTLGYGAQSLTVMRLVLGARFFNAVAFATGPAAEAALGAELADAARVVAKIEWLAAHWWRYDPVPGTVDQAS